MYKVGHKNRKLFKYSLITISYKLITNIYKIVQTQIRKKQEPAHWPTLNTVMMVENVLENMNESVISIAELKRKLPRQVNHLTLMVILEYLERSNKIAVSLKGISWLENNNPKLNPKQLLRI